MKTKLRKSLTAVLPVARSVTAFIALPLCLVALAGLLGFGIVVALDVWGDVYFVDGVPAAASFIIVVGLCGLWLLTPAHECSVRRMRFATWYEKTKAACSSRAATWLSRVVPGARHARRKFTQQAQEYASSNVKADFSQTIHPRTRVNTTPLIHSIVWGRSIKRRYDSNGCINSEVNQNYGARKHTKL